MVDGLRRAGQVRGVLKLAVWGLLAVAAATPAAAATYEVSYSARFDATALSIAPVLGYDAITLEDAGYLLEPGLPMLPARTLRIAVPGDMRVTAVRATVRASADLPGEFTPFPSQPPRRISDPVGAADFVEPDPGAYAALVPYPAEIAVLAGQGDLAGQPFAIVRVFPVQYTAVGGKLTFHSVIDLVLEGEPGYRCGDYLPAGISPRGQAGYERMLAGLVANAEEAVCTPAAEPGGSRALEPGQYDYVVIAPSTWQASFVPLAEWKTQKGVPAKIVTTSWIYGSGGYTGSYPQKIRAFIQDAHANWGASYFLFGGDTDTVPYQITHILDDDIPNDAYYADFDDDWTCEVNVGRAPVRTVTEANAFVNKVLAYEQEPPLTGFAKTAFYMGFDLNQYGSGEGEECKTFIRKYRTPAAWTVTTEYDSQPGKHYADAMAALNQGSNLINHIDHSSTDVMGVGSVNHGDYLHSSDMSGLKNGNRQGVLYTIGCWAGDYASTTCIGEAFVRNAGGGGLGFIGNSRYGWYIPFWGDGASLTYDRRFFKSLFMEYHYELGACFTDHRNDAVEPYDNYSRYIYTELTLLGDPEVSILTADPQTLCITHPESVYAGQPVTLPVTVSCGGDPVASALICAWKGDEVYAVEQTYIGGTAELAFTAATTGTLRLTVTCHNHLPYEAQISVVPLPEYTLTVSVTGQGSVALDPPGGVYPLGTTVTLTAQPAEDWHFVQWQGALAGSENPASLLMEADQAVTAVFEADLVAGDLNCDGVVDAFDIDPFVLALTDAAQYVLQYPDCDPLLADVNGDGKLDAFDIDPFVELLTGG